MEYISEGLRALAVPVETLNLDPANARLHDQRNVDAVKGTGIGVVYLGGCIFQTLYEFVVGFQDFMIFTSKPVCDQASDTWMPLRGKLSPTHLTRRLNIILTSSNS